MIGSRVLGRWGTSYDGTDYYYKAYVKTIGGNSVQLYLEDKDHDDTFYKYLSKTSIVLDVPPKPGDVKKGTKVLAPSYRDERYYLGKITYIDDGYISGRNYYVRVDDGYRKWFTIGQLRLLKNEKFCE